MTLSGNLFSARLTKADTNNVSFRFLIRILSDEQDIVDSECNQVERIERSIEIERKSNEITEDILNRMG